ncbi:MAG: diacylglycerol kinase family protein [Actinomycetota bacterium]
MSARIGLVVNPTSGKGRGAAVGRQVAISLRAAGHAVEDLTSATAEAAAKLACDAVTTGIDALVVVGGDGVVHLGLQATAGTGTPLGIVAAGSGNDIARSLGLPLHDAAAATAVLEAALTTGGHGVDAVRWSGETSGGWYAAVLAAGFDAVVNERANRWTWPRGRARYNVAIARELPVFRPRAYRLELDGEVLELEGMLVAVANCPSYGGGMRVAPDARVDDALLDVVVLEPVSTAEFVRLYPRVYSGRHVEHPQVSVRRARTVRVESPGIVGYADGERLAPLPLVCEAVPGALRVLAVRV